MTVYYVSVGASAWGTVKASVKKLMLNVSFADWSLCASA